MDNPTEITRSDVDNVVRALLGNNAYTITDHIEGENRFGTAPVRSSYFGMCHTDLTKDLSSVDGFLQKDQYPNPQGLTSEWGNVANVRFLVSSIGSISTAASNLGNNVYNIFIGGMEAYANVHQDGYSSSFIYRDAMYSGPLAMNASCGWKMAVCPRLLNDLWLFNLRATLA